MKDIYKILAILLVSLTMVITSCKKDESSSDPTPYDNVQGVWYFSNDCGGFDPTTFGLPLPTSVDVKGEGNNQLTLELSVAEELVTVDAIINDAGEVDIPLQEISITILPLLPPITLEVSGTGFIESQDSGTLTLKYKSDFLDEDITCVVTLLRDEDDEK